jgi:glycosyltransferase involved in cell wall biosynthesis
MSAYQAERHVAAALDSALAQTYPCIEIVVVDDGSTDHTPGILAEFARTRGVQVIRQANLGQSAALNRGLAAARGDYVKFFDSDDLLAPDAVAIQVAALESSPSDQLAYGEWARFHIEPTEALFTPRPGWHDCSPIEWIVTTWVDTEPMYQCALWLIPRALLSCAGGWNERLGLINDFEFFTRLVLASSGVIHTPGARLYYRSGLKDSLSRQKSRVALESACWSSRQAVAHLLAAEDSPRTRRVAAGILQGFVFAYYPAAPDLMRLALAEVRRLGGTSLRPAGGTGFRWIVRLFGWRIALCIRRWRSSHG